MGLNLADFGLGMVGVNEMLDADRARRAYEADRTYLETQRKRVDEEAAAAQEDARRRRAYEQEQRSAMAEYLAGGSKAIPAREAVAGQVLDPRQQEGGDVARAAQPATPPQANDEGMYQALKAIAQKYGRLDHYDQLEKRLKAYQDEGVVDFIKKARQGASDSELVQAFNKSGKVKLAGVRKVDDDDYQGVTEDGQPVSLNITRMTESLLGPKDLLAHTDRTADRERKARDAEEKARLAQDKAAMQGKLNDSLAGLRDAQGELARARAGTAGNGVDPNVRRPGNLNQFDNQVKSLATTYLASKVDADGKPVPGSKKDVLKLTAMASALGRQNPQLSPGEAVEAAAAKMAEIDAIRETARDQAERESDTLDFGKDEKKRKDWVQGRTERLTKMRSTMAGGDEPAAPAAPKPAAAPAAPAPAAGGYTTSDGKVLPEGTRVRNKKTGKTLVVRGGELVEE